MSSSESRVNTKVQLAAIAGLALADLYLHSLREELRLPTRIWEYESNPPHPLGWDRVVRTVSEPLVKLATGGVICHHWDWTTEQARPEYSGQVFPADPSAFPAKSLLDWIRVDTHWGWKTSYAFGVDHSRIESPRQIDGWHIAFNWENPGEIRRLRIILPPEEAVVFFVGNKPLTTFALDTRGNELPSKFVGPFHRSDKRFSHLRKV